MALDGGQQDWKFSELSMAGNAKTRPRLITSMKNLNRTESEICGWLKDRYGLSWQIILKNMEEMLSKSKAAMDAMMKMKKINIAELEKAGSQS